MRAIHSTRPALLRRVASVVAAAALAGTLVAGTATAANSRVFSVTVSPPSAVSAGGATRLDVTVQSGDNQTIANVHLSVPGLGGTLPAGVTIAAVFGPDANLCSPPTATGLSCNLGNIAGLGSRHVSVLANVSASVAGGTSLTLTASAETNNENGSNNQVERGSASVVASAFTANALNTANLGGLASTSALGTTGAGNLQSTLNLLQDNGGTANVITITETTSSTQPAVCVQLKLTCQPDSVDVSVNAGAAVLPYLETTLTANVPKGYNIKKAFLIHILANGSVESGFPLLNAGATSCAAHPNLVPCADFSLSKSSVLTIVVHTAGNGKFNF